MDQRLCCHDGNEICKAAGLTGDYLDSASKRSNTEEGELWRSNFIGAAAVPLLGGLC